MKRFLINISLFLLPLALGLFYLEYRLKPMPNSYNQKKNGIRRFFKTGEVLVVGASHTLYGVNPEFFSHTGYNLANISQTAYYDNQLLSLYLDSMPNVKLVIIPVNYSCFFKQLKIGREDWRAYFYYYYWKIPMENEVSFDFNKYSLVGIYSPYKVLSFIKAGFKNTLAPKYNQFGAQFVDSTGHSLRIDNATAWYRMKLLNEDYTEENFKNGLGEYEDLLQTVLDHNAIPVLLATPVYGTFLRYCNPDLVARNNREIDRLCSKYHCRYFSFRTDSRFSFDHFIDNDHLNYLGAEKLSKIVDSEVLKPILDKVNIQATQ